MGLFSPKGQTEFNKGIKADSEKDYATALKLFEIAAEAGHPDGNYCLSTYYLNGTGVERDLEKALYYAKRATGSSSGREKALVEHISNEIEKEKQEAEAKRQAEEKRKQAQETVRRLMTNAQTAYQNKDYNATIKYLEPLLKAGISRAQCLMAQLYHLGNGVEKDDARAVQFYLLAAEKGDAVACHNLAMFYADGKGVEKDLDEALRWAEKAKAAGSDKADSTIAVIRKAISNRDAKEAIAKSEAEFPDDKYSLQELYYLSVKYSKDGDYEKSFGLTLRLALKGVIQAQFNCGAAYTMGKGTAKDEEKAAYWYERAAVNGDSSAQTACGIIYQNGNGVAQNHEKALFWYEKAGEAGNTDAQRWCFSAYNSGFGESIKPDSAKAIYWIEKLAEKGDVTDQMACSVLHNQAGNWEKALYWEEKAAEQGNAHAQHLCGLLYGGGIGTEKDEAKSFYWFEKAAEQGNADSQYECGIHYYDGDAQDYEKSLSWFKKAAGQGHTKAQFFCAEMYYKGKGTPAHIGMARIWATKVAEQTEDPELQRVAKEALYEMRNL
ncbi:MAG: sel1 repeat family protein [Oscillospiraceae bacterium]|nr:sel1 repeat family protein [Oscillospiraceae bacterium]